MAALPSLVTPTALALVALGGGLGAVLRHLAQVASTGAFGAAFPWGTLGVNAVGGFLMGLAVALMHERTGLTPAALALTTGALGGFTTFSAFSIETLRLAEGGAPGLATAYVAASVLLALGGCWAGLALGRAL